MPTYRNAPIRLACLAAIATLVAGCATVAKPRTDDPYEGFNRKMYAFNDFADRVAIRPIAVGYRKVTNDTTRRLVSNFFANVESPITIVNDLLQGKGKYAFTATSRLVVNSTIGVLGLFDPASEMGIDAHTTDFGVTLAKWGVQEGPYLVLPLFGPSTGRDLVALPVDSYALDPLSWFARNHDMTLDAQYLPTVAYLITLRSTAIDAESLLKDAYDPYVFYRDAYRQRRLYKIYDGNPPMEAIQALQGTQGMDDVDVDKLLQEQQQYEKKSGATDNNQPQKKN
jgi:phospholipid-binding lipoprotein MlaA